MLKKCNQLSLLFPLVIGLLTGSCKTPATCRDIGDASCSLITTLFYLKVLKPRYYYGADQGVAKITQHAVNLTSGALTQIAPSAALSPCTTANTLATDLNGTYLYVACGGGSVAIVKITSGTGELALQSVPTIATTTPTGIAYDVFQRYVFISGTGGAGTVLTFVPGSNGSLNQVSSLNPSTINSGVLFAHPGGKFLYYRGGAVIASLNINQSTGTLTNGPTLGSTANGFASDPNGNYLFSSSGSSIDSYAVDQSSGALTLRSSLAFSGASWITVDTPGFIYAYGGTSAAAFSYDSAGILTALPSATTATGSSIGIRGEAQGKFVYGFSGSGLIFAHSRNADGSLTVLPPTSGMAAGAVMVAGQMSSSVNLVYATDPL